MKKSRFTLVKQLVVIAIVGILVALPVALLLPAVQSADELAPRATCHTNLNQIGITLLNYEPARMELPPNRVRCDDIGEQMNVSRYQSELSAQKKTGQMDSFSF